MIVHGTLIIIGISGLRRNAEQIFREFKHIVRITGFRSFHITYKIGTSSHTREKLTAAVTTESQRARSCNCFPKETSGIQVFRLSAKLSHTFETNGFWHLSICMFVVEIIFTLRHGNKQHFVRESLCSRQVFFITGHLVSICQRLIHSAMFHIKHRLHLFFGQAGSNINSPIAES